MKTRAAVLSAMGTAGPYAALEAVDDRGAGARPARAGRGADPDQGRRLVPLGPVGDQWQPAAANADGAGPRGGRHRRGGRAGDRRPRPRRSRGVRLRPLLRPLRPLRGGQAGLVRAGCGRRTAPARCSRAPAGCTGPTARRCSIIWASRASPSAPRSRAARWSRSTRSCRWTRPPCSVAPCSPAWVRWSTPRGSRPAHRPR